VIALNEVRKLEQDFSGSPIPPEMEQSLIAGET